ncbi:hypothetical protein FHG66_11305 [Rubellimicrobium rubrum]|uniref:RNase NYN domain-containing protein n=1 Tax=Rubellimicrobium rubrum TaxID=2585369 RepID=A0A5C4MWD8_9RHOB|nr:hypothetical protein [Rubellimicrobium rubrum]TNC49313.1 hypothetical protein FHG66_11305 [Rubellimicrobium rubrum]
MTINPAFPRQRELDETEAQVQALKDLARGLKSQFERHSAFSVSEAKARLMQARQTVAQLSEEAATLKLEIKRLQEEQKEAATRLAPWYRATAWFNAEQSAIRRRSQELTIRLRDIEARFVRIQGKAHRIEKEQGIIEGELSDHAAIDVEALQSERIDLAARLDVAIATWQGLFSERQAYDEETGPLMKQIARDRDDLAETRRKLEIARKLDTALGAAHDAAARRDVHMECERTLQTGRPRDVIRDLEPKAKRLDRDLVKTEDRLKQVQARWERRVEVLVLDGNNLCYSSDNTFIELKALKALLPLLTARYKVRLVFDATIRKRLRAGDDDIRAALRSTAEVTVMPTKTAADESIISLAKNSSTTFILSNDRYAEFAHEEPVATGRVLRFMIFPDRIQIHDLRIDFVL